MMRSNRLLFYDRNLSDFLAGLDDRMQKEIGTFGKDLLFSKSVDDLCDSMEEKYRVNVPRLIEERTELDQDDAQIDVGRNLLYSVQDRSRPAYVTGTGITFY